MKAGHVSTRRLMEHFQVSRQTITNYFDAGMPKVADGKWDMDACCAWRLKRKDDELTRRLENLDRDEQDARLKCAQADIKEHELAKLRGQTLTVDEAVHHEEQIFGIAKTQLLSLPTKLAPRFMACGSILEAKELIENEIHTVLNDISSSIRKAVEPQIARSSRGKGMAPASEALTQPVGGRKDVAKSRRLGRARKIQGAES